MHHQHWGFKKSPFGNADQSDFHVTPQHEEALARLNYLIENNHRLGLLLGPHGIGKTSTLHYLQRQLRNQGHLAASINLVGLDADSFVWQLGEATGCFPEDDRSLAAIWRDIFDRIQVNRYQHARTILMFDDADGARPEVTDSLLRLIQWKPLVENRFTVILAADSGRVMRLGRRLVELSHLRVDLRPWEQDDSAKFLQTAAEKAGANNAIFDVRALEELHRLSDGIPLRLRQLAELSLVAGAGQNLSSVDIDTVGGVHEELSFSVTL
ncbi:MAG: AAA family ATPase [Planctomycetota bacterium]